MAATAASPAHPRTVARGRYVPRGAGERATVHDALHYVQFRALGRREGPDDRALFGPVRDRVSWRRAETDLLDRASRRVLFHRIVLSPGSAHDALDPRRWTRLVMDELSQQLRLELAWVAVVHRNTEHPHVHVLLAATGTRHGTPEPVLLRARHYGGLRDAGDRVAERLRTQEQLLVRAVAGELVHLEHDRQDPAQGVGAGLGAPRDGERAGKDAAAACGERGWELSAAAALASALTQEEPAEASRGEVRRRRRRGPPGRDAGRGN